MRAAMVGLASEVDVAVIGAGAAGIAAVRRLRFAARALTGPSAMRPK